MSQRPVVFRERGHVHRADTCRPLVQAARAGAVEFQALARGAYPGRRLPLGALPGLRSVGFWNARGPQNWGLPLHRNEGIELTFLESGRMPLRVENRRFVMEPD
ncbi:MAG: AraC family transcriptional regulator, partial [Verrucomicrobiae bacterium]|nr:AraC family transcriptional regulator [Verrucomicrobiae bacterium]